MSETNGHDADADISQLDRRELEQRYVELADRVHQLERQVEKLERKPSRQVVNHLLSAVIGADVDDYTADPGQLLSAANEFHDRFADIEDQMDAVQSVGTEKTTKEQKIAQVVAFAENQRNADTNATTVTMQNIKGATGVSRRYAYDLAEDMVERYTWALDPKQQTRAVDQKQRQRGVMIDFEQLHTDPAAVNKFTTPSGRKESEK